MIKSSKEIKDDQEVFYIASNKNIVRGKAVSYNTAKKLGLGSNYIDYVSEDKSDKYLWAKWGTKTKAYLYINLVITKVYLMTPASKILYLNKENVKDEQ